MASRGRPTLGDREQFTVRLDEELMKELRLYCAVTKKSLSSIAADSTAEWWARHPEREKYKKMVEMSQEEEPAKTEQKKEVKKTASKKK